MIRVSPRIALGFIVLFGFCARAATYKSPILDHHAWRQADTASIARNFYRERFNIFYPQVDARGALEHGYVETGLELLAFLVAGISTLTGFHYETGRLLSAIFFVGSNLLVWGFVSRRYGERCGLVAAFLYAFAFPLSLFIERAFMNESLLIFLSFVCLRSAQSYLDRQSRTSIAVLVMASSLIAAVKLPYLIVWAPVVGLFIERDGRRAAGRWELWSMMLTNLVVAGAWYTHANRLAGTTGLTFGMFDKLFDPAVVFSWSFPWLIFERLMKDVLEPVGFLGVVVGLWVVLRDRRWCEILGIVGFGAYLLLVAKGNASHDYYQLPLMPIATVLAAVGLVRLSELLGQGRPERRDRLLAAALGLAVVASFVRAASAHSWYEFDHGELTACRSVQSLSDAGDRVMIIGQGSPQFLFCIDRKGWVLGAHEADETRVRNTWHEGARLAVLLHALDAPEIRRWLTDNGRLLLSTPTLEMYRLPD
jgi:4-amino-4-deoxy-L-arabinose transferase-like glycosyltransferase